MININVLHALDRDITRMPAIMPVLPLADAGWALGSSVNTLVGTIAAYLNTSTPGAVPASVQISAITLLPVDWRPPVQGHYQNIPALVLQSNGLIASKKVWPLLSCCSGGGQCD